MRGKIDTNLRWLRVVKTRPVSYGWSDQLATALAMAVRPLKTILTLMVSRIASWLTTLSRMVVLWGGSPSTTYHVRLKRGGAYLLGAYVLAVESPYLLKVSASENL